MPADKYRFVSPGVFITEVDQSQVPTPGVSDDGPVIIGRSTIGPSYTPTRIESWDKFVQMFGDTVAGGRGSDVWRNGNFTTPMYGTYAAKAYLANNSPITYVRLLGAQDINASQTSAVAGAAGWSVPDLSSTTQNGALGLFIVPSASNAATNVTGTLGAIFYCNGAAPVLSGNLRTTTDIVAQNAAMINQVASGPEFKVAISGSNSRDQIKTFNFTPSSPNFIRKVFNTNPIRTNTNTNTFKNQEGYWLGETFEKAVQGLSGSTFQAVMLGLANGAQQGGDFHGYASTDGGPTAAQSGWFISQDVNTPDASFDPATSTTNLFKFHGRSPNGSETQKRVKISIRDIRIPSAQEQSVNPYPSFTVEIRHLKDTDLRPVIFETFSNCNLNPNSSNFISRKIGDKYEVYDSDTQRLIEYGDYDNLSQHVRVEVSPDIAAGSEDPVYVPFGVKGPLRFRSFTALDDTALAPADSFVTGGAIWQCDASIGGAIDFGAWGLGASLRFNFPTASLIVSSSDMGFPRARDAYFGVNTLQTDSTNRFEDSILDLVCAKPLNYSSFNTSSVTTYQYVFTLDNIKLQAGATEDGTAPAWTQAGSRAAGTSYTALSGTAALVNDLRISKFTTLMFGGFDGLDITEGDPFRNTILDGTGTDLGETNLTNYALASVDRALNIISDAETTTFDLAAVPGVTVPVLTDKLIEKCEERGDALAIIDIEDDYQPVQEGSPDTYPILPNVANAVSTMRSRSTDSSYGCCFFPWVQTRDVPSGQMLWVPPSVVGLGTLGSSAASSELWFAPAGFNRGGLSKGAGGIAVTNVRMKLTSQQRDDLYDVRVNPIASFPTEGIVVFGQKTLQLQRSALDRINVRRLMVYLKKKISQIANTILFDQNVQATWDRFLGLGEPLLREVQSRFGLEDYKIVLDATTTTPALRDRNIMYAKVFLKPAKAIEFIAIDFYITSSGASFED